MTLLLLLPHLTATAAAAAALSTLLLLICSSIIFLKKRKNQSSNSSPPEAGGGWPIIGHLPLLSGSKKLPHMALGELADKHGPIFTIKLGLSRAVVVSSHELAKELFTTNDLSVSSRPPLISGKLLAYDHAGFGFAPYGPFWRGVRKIISVELLSTRRLQLLKKIRVFEIEESVRELYKHWAEEKTDSYSGGGGGGVVVEDMRDWFGDINLNVILKMVAGKRYCVVGGGEGRRCKELFREFFHLAGLFLLGDAVPFLGFLDLGGFEKAMRRIGGEVDGLMSGWLDEHKKKRGLFDGGGGGGEEGEKDFMDVLISSLGGGGVDLCGFDADTVNKATSMAMIAGGTDTTTVTLTWALALLLNNPSVLKRAQAELDGHVGRERMVAEEDMDELVYLKAIVKETMRLYPAGALSGAREFTADCTIKGYKVRAGTRLIVNLWKIQRDPRVWGDASEYRPERFMEGEQKDVDVKGQNFELIPFGAGRRMCPGWAFGLQMTQLVLATFIHAFEMCVRGRVDMSQTAGLTNAKATPLQLVIKPRLHHSLY